uniref:SLC26A/SulP transporter domain-containing protein n=1 Tax=Proboscia inermis TaxID=420281 RepID=A0A7S0C7C6_9STRA|mmetsp:Transcript_30124/g.30482  ORF Transcript_30124/g.30482 Transcript_30124/m.30482 type:complete len:256 (+) Transcript_30124:72-839(+)
MIFVSTFPKTKTQETTILHKGLPKFNPFKDILSGLMTSCSPIPQLIAHAKTAGYASYRRILTAGLTLVLWGLSTDSLWLNFGVTAITALMTKSDLGAENYVKQHEEEEYVKLMASYLICAGLASITMGVLGVGKIVNYVPKMTKIEFKLGCMFGVVLSVLSAGILTFGLSTAKSIVATQQELQDWIVTLTTAVTVANGALSTLKLLYISPKPELLDTTAILIVVSTTIFIAKCTPPASKVLTATAAATLYYSQSS